MKNILPVVCSSAVLIGSASAATTFNSGKILATADTSYGVDTTATLISSSIAAGDGLATFQVSFDITPTAGTQIVSNGSGFWGVDDISFSGSEAVANIGNIQVVNFSSGGGSLTAADIVNLSFDFVAYVGAVGGSDAGFVTAGGNTGNWVDMNAGSDFVGHVSGGDGVGGVQLSGTGADSLAGTSIVSSFELGAENASTAWRIDSISVSGEVVPEPSSTALLGLGGLALILRRRK